MVTSKTKLIGTGATIGILGLLSWFIATGVFQVQMEGDIKCDGTFEDMCDWHFNITNTGVAPYYIYNKNAIALTFEPQVKQFWLCKKDGRYSGKAREDREKYPCGVGYREFFWNESLTSKYSYVEKFSKGDKKEYKVAILKHNPNDKVKFGGNLAVQEFDPFLLPREDWEYIQECKTKKPAYTKTEQTIGLCSRIDYINSTIINNATGINSTSTRSAKAGWFCYNGTRQVEVPAEMECKEAGILVNGKKILYAENGYTECVSQDGGICCVQESQGDKNGKCDKGEGIQTFDSELKPLQSTITKTSRTKEVQLR